MRTHTDEKVPICITCYRAGCQKCGGLFDRDKYRPVEHIVRGKDGDLEEALVYCLACEQKVKRGRAKRS